MRFKRVYIEITNACNLSCSFCIKNDRPIHSMTIEEIMEETGNVLGVRMTVYRMVTKLVKLGYLEKGVMDNHANTYYVTNDGRKLFKEDKAE